LFRHYGLSVFSKVPLVVRRESENDGAVEVVSFQHAEWSVIGLYKSPNKTLAPLGSLLTLLERVLPQDGGARVIVVGDSNVDMAKSGRDTSDRRRLVAWMTDKGLIHHDVGSTTELISAIDQIWSTQPLSPDSMAIYSYYSDHMKLLVYLPQ
jgi:hypothetical protein